MQLQLPNSDEDACESILQSPLGSKTCSMSRQADACHINIAANLIQSVLNWCFPRFTVPVKGHTVNTMFMPAVTRCTWSCCQVHCNCSVLGHAVMAGSTQSTNPLSQSGACCSPSVHPEARAIACHCCLLRAAPLNLMLPPASVSTCTAGIACITVPIPRGLRQARQASAQQQTHGISVNAQWTTWRRLRHIVAHNRNEVADIAACMRLVTDCSGTAASGRTYT